MPRKLTVKYYWILLCIFAVVLTLWQNNRKTYLRSRSKNLQKTEKMTSIENFSATDRSANFPSAFMENTSRKSWKRWESLYLMHYRWPGQKKLTKLLAVSVIHIHNSMKEILYIKCNIQMLTAFWMIWTVWAGKTTNLQSRTFYVPESKLPES